LVEDRALDQRGAAAAVLLRPGEPRVAVLVELLLPGAAELEGLLVAGGLPAGIVASEPLAQLVAEGLLLRGQSQIHEVSRILSVNARGALRVAQCLLHDPALVRDLQPLLEQRYRLVGLARAEVRDREVVERVGVVDVSRAG